MNPCTPNLVLTCLLLVLSSAECAAHGEPSTIATSGNPASLVVFGDADSIATLGDGTVLAARAIAGQGRVVAIGHGGFLNDDRGDTAVFLDEQVTWLCQDGASTVWRVPEPMLQRLATNGLDLESIDADVASLDFEFVELVVGSPQAFARAGRLQDLSDWLASGGALLSLETAWGQIQLGHATGTSDLAANTLLSEYGILYTDRALSPGRDGLYTLDAAANTFANSTHALRVLAGEIEGDLPLAARVARQAFAVVPADSTLFVHADTIARNHTDALNAAYASMAGASLKLAEQPLACALFDLEARRAAQGEVGAHPSASAFPGAVPDDAPRITRRVELDAIGGWRSTGLYAAPGEPITARVLKGNADSLNTQIGCWLDPQDFDDRYRFPVAVYRAPFEDGTSTLASPIGGPVYIDLGDGVGPVTVEISGAVEMPRYRLGETDLDEWRDRIRHLPAPWVELESDNLAFSLPAEVVRGLDRPDLVMRHWDQVHAAMEALEPRSPRHWPDRQYRYVAEKKLSWGYMYCPSNAPIVIPLNEAGAMVDLASFDALGPNELWGHYHEMGHAHQNPMWTFAGTGEVTVNIFTVLALHTVNGYPLDHEAMRSDPERALSAMHAHIEKGAPFHRWKSDPFLALQTYALLWHAFGFDAFDRAFRSYESMSQSERPREDQAKRDRFVIQMSKAVERNLEPYFRAWGVPLTESLSDEIARLPTWMPEGYESSSP